MKPLVNWGHKLGLAADSPHASVGTEQGLKRALGPEPLEVGVAPGVRLQLLVAGDRLGERRCSRGDAGSCLDAGQVVQGHPLDRIGCRQEGRECDRTCLQPERRFIQPVGEVVVAEMAGRVPKTAYHHLEPKVSAGQELVPGRVEEVLVGDRSVSSSNAWVVARLISPTVS